MKNKILNLWLVLILLIGMAPTVYAPSYPINNTVDAPSYPINNTVDAPSYPINNDDTNIRACYKNCDSIPRQRDIRSRNLMRYKECISKCDRLAENTKDPIMGVCIQVITPAMNPETKECKEFSTPCDVPKGWKKVGSCQGLEIRNEMKEKRKEMMKDQIKTIKDEKAMIKGNTNDFAKRCRTQETNECKEKFKGLKSSLGNHYVNVLEMLEKQLNIIKESGIDVSKQVDSINALKTRVSAINEQTTKEELRKLHSDIKALTKEIKEFHQKSKRMMTLSKFGGVLEKAEKLEKKLDNILENAKKGNKDTSNLNSLIESFKEHVAKAKEYQDGMMKRADGMMKDMTELMRKAHAELKEAHAVLIKIHQELKEKKIIGGGEA